MDTLLTDVPEEAAACVRRGELAAFPTETVYGLGGSALDPAAIEKIFAAKGRPGDNPLIVHLSAAADVRRVAARVSAAARLFLDAFVPGPLTLILPRRPEVPVAVSGGLDTVGVRVPAHPVAQAFLAACRVPVAAPSANLSGRPSPTTWEAVEADLGGRIACILRGGASAVGLESTVVDCTGEWPLVLRAGAVTVEALQQVVPATRPAEGKAEMLRRSPGTRYRHYAPDARVIAVDHPREAEPSPLAAYIGLDAPAENQRFGYVAVCRDLEAYARRLFAFFRESDARGMERVYCQRVGPAGLGTALMDRIVRAAGG